MSLKMSSAKWRAIWLGLNVLKRNVLSENICILKKKAIQCPYMGFITEKQHYCIYWLGTV